MVAKAKIINERVAAIAPSVTLGIDSRAKEMVIKGKKVYSFAAGEPDFDTPGHIKKAAAKALEAGETKYTPVAGLQALRTVIAAKFEKDNELRYEPSHVVVSNGAKHTLFNIFMAICREGDEVIIPAPYWLSYPEMVNVAGGKSVFVHCREENDFKMTPAEFEKAITRRTKAVVINSPSNPIGVVYSGYELKVIAEIAVSHGMYIISDEIYEKMMYDNTVHVSVGSISSNIFDRTITVNGFSKAYAMTGWRLGYFAGPMEIVRAVNAFQSHSTSGPNTFAQFGGIEALKGPQDCVAEMVKAFAERRVYMYQRLTAIKGITCVKPMGAFYMLPNISQFGLDSVSFAEQLLEREGVAVVPGMAFGADRNVRLSYACSTDNIRKGLDRLEKFVKSL
ncbi:MAG: pyridoxal phosphate-dependent aminotransferase [Kiritimatiellae bacterium]|nr:pyridoxal phosphate-dependent aminotransferase [Kiritimatiellia bacterium]MDD5520428.1 pyridoxal phosphate-dependent aminotransferase [Kiritimatiellia bacterium]